MTDSLHPPSDGTERRKMRLAYLVSHPIQYQAPLLRRIALEPTIDLTVLFGSDFSVRGYKDRGFGVEVAWDTPLLDGYRSEFLRPFRDTGEVSPTAPISRGIFRRLQQSDGSPAFDALWVHGYASINSLQAILAANALGIPVLLRAESWLADRARSPWTLVLKSAFFKLLGNGISAVLPIGTVNAEYWTHYFGTSVPQFLMPYAVNNEYFAGLAAAAVPREQELRAELGLSAERPVILFASKLQQRKHADHLLEAYSRFIADRTPQERPYLVVVGDGEQRAQLEAQAQQLGLEDVRFAGFRNQSELPRFFQLADVFVLPSRHEPWGLIVNEAMASGCPVIVSTDVGCYADLITDGVEGCVFLVGDIPALTRALHQVFSCPRAAARMGEAAARRITSWTYEEDVQGLRRALTAVTRLTKDW
ncbi:MAG: glycosyltransferase family 4 protein [Acidobacteriaceae bacterium]|jgi:glycosyltransferase involved in cell wall biosynthesis